MSNQVIAFIEESLTLDINLEQHFTHANVPATGGLSLLKEHGHTGGIFSTAYLLYYL